jgi:hypothetical protein
MLLSQLVHSFLYSDADSKESAVALFPADFHSAIRGLVKVLGAKEQ